MLRKLVTGTGETAGHETGYPYFALQFLGYIFNNFKCSVGHKPAAENVLAFIPFYNSYYSIMYFIQLSCMPVAQAGWVGVFNPPPPHNRKKLLQKNDVIPSSSICSKSFPKIDKNTMFYCIFIKNFQNFLKISQQFVIFVQRREEFTHRLLNFQKNMLNLWIFPNFLKKSFETFENFSKFPTNFCLSS